jgi:hypothetical protein
MKNIKCVIGATILAPVGLACLVAIMVGFILLMGTFPLLGKILGIGALSFMGLIMWGGIYSYCVEHSAKEAQDNNVTEADATSEGIFK